MPVSKNSLIHEPTYFPRIIKEPEFNPDHNYINQAIQEFLNSGGEIIKLNPIPDYNRVANLYLTISRPKTPRFEM